MALRIGLIGSGFIGRSHSIALSAVGSVFPDIEPPVLEVIAEADAARAQRASRELGFRRAATDWRELVADPNVDVVDVCSPNYLHREMALAAIKAGKHVYCEKPLALDVTEAREVVEAARRAKVVNLTGFNYACNPLVRVAAELISSGELGQLFGFRGRYYEDYMADPAVPHSWRCERRLAGSGALADLGSHLINMAHVLIGPIAKVNARLTTVHTQRREPSSGQMRPVENEDTASALVEFASGLNGTFDISRVATGYKCGLAFRIFGSRGSVAFDQERMNELRLYSASDPSGLRGFRTVLAGPEHPDYRNFCPAPGHGLGINDLKIIEARNLIEAVAGKRRADPDFLEGLRVQQVMEAMERSHERSAWEAVPRDPDVA